MDLAIFRERLRYYLTLAEKNQKSLAAALNMHPNVLSRKLNNTSKAIFSHSEVKELIRFLIQWGSLNYRTEVTELLDLIGFKTDGFFTSREWQLPPLNMLEDGPYPPVLSWHSSAVKSALTLPNPDTSKRTVVEPTPFDLILPHSKSNLPQAGSSFIGRTNEISDLVGVLTGKVGLRLLTLTGVGGTGKTRLALEVAAKLLPDFRDGIYFLGLENVTERATLISELMATLGISNTSSIDKALLDALKKYLSSRQMLLILDNFEQLVENGATLLPELLKAAPELKILVTSRFPLQLSNEHEYRVASLSVPTLEELQINFDPAHIEQYPAIALFTDRAQAAKPEFSITVENKRAVVEICRKLDGLPLALELAAARLRAFPPEILLERLSLQLLRGGARDLPVRQQTLRATIEWSYDLLSPGEQALFAKLSIFAGGFTLEAAEKVCEPEEQFGITPLEGIESLLLKNLLRRWEDKSGTTRYGMLQTIGEFGQEKLKERGDWSRLTQQYAFYYLKRVQKLESQVKSKGQIAAFKTLDSEYDNLRMILSTGLKEGETAITQFAIELAIYLEFFWDQHNHLAEGREYLELALALTDEHNSKHTMLLNRLGNLIWRQGEYLTARSCFEAALILSRQGGDKFETALSLHGLALILNDQVSFAESLNFYEESLLLRHELGDKFGLCRNLINLGEGYLELCNYEKALQYLEESLEVGRQLGNKRSISHTLMGLGRVTGDGYRDYKTGRAYFEEALSISQEIGDNYISCGARIGIGAMTLYQGEYEACEQYLVSALDISRETGEKRLTGYSLNLLGKLALEQQDFAKSRLYYQEGLLLWGEMGSKGMVGEILTGLSLLRSLQTEGLEAQYYTAHLGGAISTLLTSTGSIVNLSLKDKYEKALETARLTLGAEEFNNAFTNGCEMSLREMVKFAINLDFT